MKRKKPQTYEQQFITRTRSIYAHMVERFAEKRDKRDRIIRIGQQIPFTLQHFRERLLTFFGGSPGGSASCRYCHAWVTIEDVAADHEVPVSRGACNLDFHIAVKPAFCPGCGVAFKEEKKFGEHRG